MTPYAHFSPMTDTREMPAVLRGVPLADAPTQVIAFPYLRPVVTPARRRFRLFRRGGAR